MAEKISCISFICRCHLTSHILSGYWTYAFGQISLSMTVGDHWCEHGISIFIKLRWKTTQAQLSLMGSKGQDDHRIAVSVVYKKQLVYSQGQAPEKEERIGRKWEKERERRTYQSGPQGKPDPAGVLTCLISMSRTQPDKTISLSSFHFSSALLAYIQISGDKKNLLLIHM